MNRYPAWKYTLVAVVILIGLLYTIPNFYGESPAVQISPAKSTLKADAALLKKVEATLQLADIKFNGIFLDANGVKVRFASPDEQIKAKDKLIANLGKDYSVALNLLSQTPNWLLAIGAKPMYLGLDLRGGVHFLLQVDMKAALDKAAESSVGDFRTSLRREKINYFGIEPLAVIPGGLAYDKETFPMPQPDARTETGAALTVGEWIGVSGAAFTTGLGRRTSLSYSLFLGLANVRLGRWWGSQIRASSLRVRDTGLRAAFKTQIYLFDELLARFHGTRRAWQYLSDGGHFENTAAYELLRPQRKIKLIVICDCGADPKYEFGDLANLTRLARIDFGIELEVDGAVTNDVNLGSVFGKTTDFFRGKDGALPLHDKCAVLVNVYHDARLSNIEVGERRKDPDARIIVLKPRLLTSSAADLCEYRATHPAFPQEPTADQFFDEAQWESYRRLGMEVAMRVFPGRDSPQAYRAAFFEKILA